MDKAVWAKGWMVTRALICSSRCRAARSCGSYRVKLPRLGEWNAGTLKALPGCAPVPVIDLYFERRPKGARWKLISFDSVRCAWIDRRRTPQYRARPSVSSSHRALQDAGAVARYGGHGWPAPMGRFQKPAERIGAL